MLKFNYTVICLNSRDEKLRLDFTGKNARSEAYALVAEIDAKHGKRRAWVEEAPQTKTFKTADAALGDAEFWIKLH